MPDSRLTVAKNKHIRLISQPAPGTHRKAARTWKH